VLRGHLIEVADVEAAACLDLRVVVEVSLVPRSGRHLTRLRPQLLDDARDGDELDLERVADEDFVEERGPARMIVAVGEPRTIVICFASNGLGALASESLDGGGASDGDEPTAARRERLLLSGPRDPSCRPSR
jgi:hypothetical protein